MSNTSQDRPARGSHLARGRRAVAVIIGGVFASAAPAATLSLNIAPGKFDEHCFKLAAGAEVKYRFKASGEIDFNIHYHRDKDVFFPVKHERVLRHAGAFRAPAADDYCLMWENKGEKAVTVRGNTTP